MTLTLRSRLTLVQTAVFGVLLLGIGSASYRILAYQLDADVSANLAELTRGLHGYLRLTGPAPAVEYDANDSEQAAFVEQATRYYQVFDAASGELLAQSDALGPLGLEFTPGEVRQFRDQPRTIDVQTDYGRIRLSNSVLAPPGGRTYLLQVGVSLAHMDGALRRFLALLVIGVPAALVAAFLAGRWMAGVALRPLGDLADAARTIGVDDLRQRLPTRGARDELDAVAMAFNETLARLEHAIGDMRQFSAALAHELRTPLAALRGSIELAMLQPGGSDETRQRLAGQLEEVDRLKRLIDQILTLARAEAGELPFTMGRVDLRALAKSLVEQIEPVAQAKGVELICEGRDAAIVRGDADWLERLALNLLDNAVKFTPRGGRIDVTVDCDGAAARLVVRDTGVGIDADARPHIFEPFFRADPARSSEVEGAGLGLSLAQWIAERHHGRIDVESRPGRGSTFTVVLPGQAINGS